MALLVIGLGEAALAQDGLRVLVVDVELSGDLGDRVEALLLDQLEELLALGVGNLAIGTSLFVPDFLWGGNWAGYFFHDVVRMLVKACPDYLNILYI